LSPRGRPKRIRPAALHGVLVTHLRELIQNGGLAPGELIVENELSQQLGVSRTPLREALKVLSSEGLVELRPHRTPIVAPVDAEEIAAIFEVLESLEALAGRLAGARRTTEDLARLEQMHAEMVARHEAGDRDGYAGMNRNIHAGIVAIAGNPPLQAVYTSFGIKVQRARSTTNYDARRWAESIAEHERIMNALRKGSPEDLSAVLAEHTRNTGTAVIATLRRVSAERQEGVG
jgi:DNA-binding GntR family transcriptional regulator